MVYGLNSAHILRRPDLDHINMAKHGYRPGLLFFMGSDLYSVLYSNYRLRKRMCLFVFFLNVNSRTISRCWVFIEICSCNTLNLAGEIKLSIATKKIHFKMN